MTASGATSGSSLASLPARMNPPGEMREDRGTVSVHALGCKANQEEMECLLSRLVESGYRVVPFGEPADWTIVNTCTVTAAADSDSRQMIRRASRVQAGGRVIVTGCLAQRDPAGLARLPGVSWVVGNGEKPSLSRWILDETEVADSRTEQLGASGARVLVGADPTLEHFAEYGRARDGRRARASLKVQDGCDEHCTFCVIPQVRGRSRSRSLVQVLTQARELVQSGYREIALTGINTALWGRDRPEGSELSQLLSALEAVPGLERIRLNSLEPQWVKEEWLDLIAASAKLCRHLHLPLQSGDDGVLKRMNRRYTTGQYASLVRAVHERMPDASIGCDVLVGFPGESAESFERTHDFLSDLPLSYLHVFTYSPRPDTPAPRLGEEVPVEVKKVRSSTLRSLDRRLRERFAEKQLGSVQTVLPEAASGSGHWQGLTGNYLRVRFAWPALTPPGGEPRLVLLDGWSEDRTIRGRLLPTGHRPRNSHLQVDSPARPAGEEISIV